MYRACSKCGRIHSTKYKCNKNNPKWDNDRYGAGDERKARSTKAWQDKRQAVKEQAQYLCEVCRDKGIYNYNGLEVHHIIKLKDNMDGLLKDDNLICLCTEHHKQADRGQLSIDYLTKLAQRRLNTDNPPRIK